MNKEKDIDETEEKNKKTPVKTDKKQTKNEINQWREWVVLLNV